MDEPRCQVCRELIGVYEPIVVTLRDGSKHEGGRLTISSLLARAGSVAIHKGCEDAGDTVG